MEQSLADQLSTPSPTSGASGWIPAGLRDRRNRSPLLENEQACRGEGHTQRMSCSLLMWLSVDIQLMQSFLCQYKGGISSGSIQFHRPGLTQASHGQALGRRELSPTVMDHSSTRRTRLVGLRSSQARESEEKKAQAGNLFMIY